jgi:hypothetical protein
LQRPHKSFAITVTSIIIFLAVYLSTAGLVQLGIAAHPAVMLHTASTAPGDAHWDSRFTYPGVFNGDVHALAFDQSGNLYIGGSFVTVGGISGEHRKMGWDKLVKPGKRHKWTCCYHCD